MNWTRTLFLEWLAWESGRFRIIETESGKFDLFEDCGISTAVTRDFKTLEEAIQKAEAIGI